MRVKITKGDVAAVFRNIVFYFLLLLLFQYLFFILYLGRSSIDWFLVIGLAVILAPVEYFVSKEQKRVKKIEDELKKHYK